MKLTSKEMLQRLGNGEMIAKVCEITPASHGRSSTPGGRRAECVRRYCASNKGTRKVGGVARTVRIERDGRGVAHVHADGDRDVFFGFGYAVAQDRLFQLDFLRRKARGRLAAGLGPDGIESDVLYRTIGLAQIAEKEWPSLPAEIRELLSAYTSGINALMEETRGCLPIEFDLLGYQPEPWRETDSLAIVGEFRWYLTGRFPVIAIPELVKRAVGDGGLTIVNSRCAGGQTDENVMHPRGELSQILTPTPLPEGEGSQRAAMATAAATIGCSTATAPTPASRSSPTIRTFPITPSRSGMKFGCTAAPLTLPASRWRECPAS